MMHFNKWSRGAAMLLGFFLISQTEAQVVKTNVCSLSKMVRYLLI